MNAGSILTRSDYEDFLIRWVFGREPGLTACITTAYGDLSRTVHGMGSLHTRDVLYEGAVALLGQSFEHLRHSRLADQEAFDDWHRETCGSLKAVFARHGQAFHVGQAQKWINMTFKYIYTLGESHVLGYGTLYPFCHVPLDNILIEQLSQYEFKALPDRWSRLDNYDIYLDRQKWVRHRFKEVPLDVELLLWQDPENRARSTPTPTMG